MLYVGYKLLQLAYTSFYYYFLPFVATFYVWIVLVAETESIATKKY